MAERPPSRRRASTRASGSAGFAPTRVGSLHVDSSVVLWWSCWRTSSESRRGTTGYDCRVPILHGGSAGDRSATRSAVKRGWPPGASRSTPHRRRPADPRVAFADRGNPLGPGGVVLQRPQPKMRLSERGAHGPGRIADVTSVVELECVGAGCGGSTVAVSYTHLTLPTSDLV